MRKLVYGIIAACLALPLLAATAHNSSTTSGCLPTATSRPASSTWDTEQLGNARTISTVGHHRGIAVRGLVIATATAIQESGLRNLPGGDRDSIGLFQQRPSQGWGTPTQLADPTYQAGRFYDRLLTVNGWQQMPLTDAAQAVQKSAYPHAYARHETAAALLVDHLAAPTPGNHSTAGDDPGQCADTTAVFDRARTWLTAWAGNPVPYLSSNEPATLFDGYRRDCSGYISMALGLPGPGLNTSGLAARATAITRDQLQPGDLLINTAPNLRGHVVLFERWADPARTRYWAYEQTGSSDTQHRVIPYPYFGRYLMTPYRLIDTPQKRSLPPWAHT
jgi:cell wall-associated NlpC family hydrolase